MGCLERGLLNAVQGIEQPTAGARCCMVSSPVKVKRCEGKVIAHKGSVNNHDVTTAAKKKCTIDRAQHHHNSVGEEHAPPCARQSAGTTGTFSAASARSWRAPDPCLGCLL